MTQDFNTLSRKSGLNRGPCTNVSVFKSLVYSRLMHALIHFSKIEK